MFQALPRPLPAVCGTQEAPDLSADRASERIPWLRDSRVPPGTQSGQLKRRMRAVAPRNRRLQRRFFSP